MRTVLLEVSLPFGIKTIPVFSYDVLYALAICVGILLAIRFGKRRGLPPGRLLNACLLSLLTGNIGARIFFIAQYYPYYFYHPSSLYRLW